MKSNKQFNTANISNVNLIGENRHRYFLTFQTSYGLAQSGGSETVNYGTSHTKRLVSSVNMLTSKETRKLIFSETSLNN